MQNMTNPSAPALASLPPLPQPPQSSGAVKVVTLPQPSAPSTVAAAPGGADTTQQPTSPAGAQTVAAPVPLPVPQPVIYNYPPAAQGYYPPPMLMQAPAPFMVPSLPASVALNPYLAAALGHPAKAPEAKPETAAPEKKGFFGHLYRLIQPENFNWAGNVGAGVVLGPVMQLLWAYAREGSVDNAGTQYKRFQLEPNGPFYRQYMLPVTKLEAATVQATKEVSVAKAPVVINSIWEVPKAIGNLLNGTSKFVNGAYSVLEDAAKGTMNTGSSEMRAHVIVQEGPAQKGWFASGPELKKVAQFDWDNNVVTHFDDAGRKIKEVAFGPLEKSVTLFENGEAALKNIYKKAEQGVIGGRWRLNQVMQMENGVLPVPWKSYEVYEESGKKLIKEVAQRIPGSNWIQRQINSDIVQDVGRVPGVFLNSMSEWLKIPASAKTVIERTPWLETFRKVINPHQLALAAFIGGIVTAGLAIFQQPHHTVVRLGE
jgi:hypothetical protein